MESLCPYKNFQMGILKNMFHKVQKPLERLEGTFLRLKTHTEVRTNDLMCVFRTLVSHLSGGLREECSI